MAGSTSHFICLPCRASFKKAPDYLRARTDLCPRCGGPLLNAGSALAVPRRRDVAGWRALSAVLGAGLRFRQGCCGGPGYRPRTLREVKERLAHAERTGLSPAEALARYDLSGSDVRRRAGRGDYAPRSAETRPARGRGR
ncbi:deoxyxylulose-5-phosphate synthase [Streptomyces sp. NPDC002730]|uniref:deoxyxylulose-5-phosphate synthase n=1 Tax=Streptomyces sp. NPDC002730 TaxID=3364662 RepID=UPI00369E4451